jgi:hypothetical protein
MCRDGELDLIMVLFMYDPVVNVKTNDLIVYPFNQVTVWIFYPGFDEITANSTYMRAAHFINHLVKLSKVGGCPESIFITFAEAPVK